MFPALVLESKKPGSPWKGFAALNEELKREHHALEEALEKVSAHLNGAEGDHKALWTAVQKIVLPHLVSFVIHDRW